MKFLIMFVLTYTALIIFWLPGVSGQQGGNINIQSAFDPRTATWNIAWPGRVSQYDLVYLNPPVDPLQGIPLGNGDIGVLFWCDGSKIITVERFGSRTFSHWYSQINKDANMGLCGTDAAADSSGVSISQKLSSGTFAAGGRVIQNNGVKVDYSLEHSRCAVIKLSGGTQKSAQLSFAVTSPGAGNPISEAKKLLNKSGETGFDILMKSNAEVWKPIWNQQQLSWPLNAAGFHDLVKPYLDFRFNSLPRAKMDAKAIFNANGTFISDVTDRRGYNSSGKNANHTPVAEIALDFWRQYQYTCDKKFLKERALPFIIAAARFFETLLVKEADRLYHAL